MSASYRSRGVPPRVTGLLILSVVGALAASCTASSPSASPSPPFSPSVEPNPSPPFSPVVDPNPSPPFSPVVDPNPSPPPSSSGPAWEDAGSLTREQEWPLSDYHALLVGKGRVLVVGPKTAELWDLGSNAWRATTPLNKPRYEFAAIALADGRVLVTGGLNGDHFGTDTASFSSTYIYDPRPGHEDWTKVGLLGTARTLPAIARLPDGRVLVAGGYFYTRPTEGRVDAPRIELAAYHPGSVGTAPGSGPLYDADVPPWGFALATAELFDPTTGTWSATAPMKYARAGAAAVTLADGRILVVGSEAANVTGIHPDAYRTAEIYDPATGRFSSAGRFPDIDVAAIEKLEEPGGNQFPGEPDPEENGALAPLADGGAVLIGHAGWWKHVGEMTRSFRFDAHAGTWTEIGQTYVFVGEPTAVPMRTPGVRRLVGAMVAALPDGRVLVAGGAGAIPKGSPYSNTPTTAVAELYEPKTDTWSPLPPMPEPRQSGMVVVLHDGSLLLVGGRDEPPSREGVTLTSAVRFVPSH